MCTILSRKYSAISVLFPNTENMVQDIPDKGGQGTGNRIQVPVDREKNWNKF